VEASLTKDKIAEISNTRDVQNRVVISGERIGLTREIVRAQYLLRSAQVRQSHYRQRIFSVLEFRFEIIEIKE
jgi:hypothetical protein